MTNAAGIRPASDSGGIRRHRLVCRIALAGLVISLAGCSLRLAVPFGPTPQPRQALAQSTARAAADAVLVALKARDGKGIAALAHPDKGIRFSPYAFVDVKQDVVLQRASLLNFWTDPTPRVWGTADGTGDPIRLSPGQYYERYVFDRDFTAASTVSMNHDRASGNTVNNATTAYPGATRIEYYIPPTLMEGQPGIDWRALRVVLEPKGQAWYVVGLIHDEWTI